MTDGLSDNNVAGVKRRVWEIDFIRGIAILFMVVIHFYLLHPSSMIFML